MTLTSLTSLTTMTTSENLFAKLCFGRVLKRFLSAHLVQVKLLLVTVYLNGRLRAVSIGKPCQRMSNLRDLAKYSTTLSVVRSACDS